MVQRAFGSDAISPRGSCATLGKLPMVHKKIPDRLGRTCDQSASREPLSLRWPRPTLDSGLLTGAMTAARERLFAPIRSDVNGQSRDGVQRRPIRRILARLIRITLSLVLVFLTVARVIILPRHRAFPSQDKPLGRALRMACALILSVPFASETGVAQACLITPDSVRNFL